MSLAGLVLSITTGKPYETMLQEGILGAYTSITRGELEAQAVLPAIPAGPGVHPFRPGATGRS